VKNKIEDLRNHLFATLEALRDPDKPMEIERAKTIAEVAQVIVNTAKVEVEFIEATGRGDTGFLPDARRTAIPSKPERLTS
jgi:dUTPase